MINQHLPQWRTCSPSLYLSLLPREPTVRRWPPLGRVPVKLDRAGTLILDFQSSELCENKFLLFKPHHHLRLLQQPRNTRISCPLQQNILKMEITLSTETRDILLKTLIMQELDCKAAQQTMRQPRDSPQQRWLLPQDCEDKGRKRGFESPGPGYPSEAEDGLCGEGRNFRRDEAAVQIEKKREKHPSFFFSLHGLPVPIAG